MKDCDIQAFICREIDRRFNSDIYINDVPLGVYAKTGGWIDVNDRKPPEDHHILVTIDHGLDDLEVCELDYGTFRYMAENGRRDCEDLIKRVIAWMELPKPFRRDDT